MRFTIRTKLFFMVFVAFSALIGITSWQINIQADAAALSSIERSLEQSGLILNTKLSSRKTTIEDTANGIARDGRILPLVFDAEGETLQDLGLEFKEILEFDILFFTDAEGTVLARPDRPEAIGRNVSQSSLFAKALNGEAAGGVITSRGKLLQMVVVPIFDNVALDVVRGSVALAYEFSEDMALEIYALTSSNIGFFVFDHDEERQISGVKSSYNTDAQLQEHLEQYFNSRMDQLNELLDANHSATDAPMDISGEEYYYVVHNLSNDGNNKLGFIMALHSKDALLKPFTQIQQTVYMIGLSCLIAALAFAIIFSRKISRPIVEMVKITKNIENGSFQKQEKPRGKGDEIVDLYKAIISMGNALGEKAELENYLANIGKDLDLDESISNLNLDDSFADSTIKKAPDANPDATRIINTNSNVQSQPTRKTRKLIDKRYEIIKPLGIGAMGKVYLANDLELKENVAIKVMDKGFFSEKQSLDFREEIRLARQITHRNIVRTYDYGDWQRYYYITMEYVQGFDLKKLIDNKGAFDIHVGTLMARQICSALIAAHEQGIIHRDLKPANMLINRQGILKIMDFGLATRLEKNDALQSGFSQKFIAGTPRFMAPEQFDTANLLDERTDIYAMG